MVVCPFPAASDPRTAEDTLHSSNTGFYISYIRGHVPVDGVYQNRVACSPQSQFFLLAQEHDQRMHPMLLGRPSPAAAGRL